MKSKENEYTLIIILIIVGIIIIYLVTFGQFDISEKIKNADNFDDEKLTSKHQRLKNLIEKKEALNKKLNRKFKFIYFGVRVVLSSLYLGFNAVLYFVFKIREVGEILNWNEFTLIILSLLSFITFGSFTNIKKFVYDLKLKLETWVYGKYINIDEQISLHKIESKNISKNNIEKPLLEVKELIVN
ncbi:MAG: hypothetical protein ABFS12_03720 [Bacteroidota bacterium]